MRPFAFTAFFVVMLGKAAVAQAVEIVCPDFCAIDPPVCTGANAFLDGSEDCWRCCHVICPGPVASTACLTTKPICLETEAASGVEGCWGCCFPLSALS